MANPQIQIKNFCTILSNIFGKLHLFHPITPFLSYYIIIFVDPLRPKAVKTMSENETQSGSYRFVLNPSTAPLRFPYWCHCELCVPCTSKLYPDCCSDTVFLSYSLKCQSRLSDMQTHHQEIKVQPPSLSDTQKSEDIICARNCRLALLPSFVFYLYLGCYGAC